MDTTTMARTKKAKKKRTRTSEKADQNGDTMPQALRLEVTRIHPYERNPRHCPNPEYDRIKASIRASGLDQALRITRRPGDDDYIVQAGGNTRLQVLKELYESSGEERFLWIDCLFVEWERESAVLLAHLRENELRGSLSFIDRARAVVEIQALVAAELKVEDLSDRELAQFLKEHGYYASRSLISVMDYAVSVLLPVLPRALEAGLGRPQVQRIRNLQRVGQDVWGLFESGEDGEYIEVFETLCRRHDHEDWLFDLLRQAIETEIAEAAEIRIQRVRMEFDCRLEGSEPEIPAFVHDEATEEAQYPMSRRDEPNVVSGAERKALAQAVDSTEQQSGLEHSGEAEQGPAAERADLAPDSHEIAVELPPGPDINAVLRRIVMPAKGRMPLALLRETAFELASRLAEGHGLGSLVESLPDEGLGYLVCGLPPAEVIEQLDPELRAEVLTLWWQLIVFADMAGAPPAVIDVASSDHDFAAALKEGDFARVVERVPPAGATTIGQGFWARLHHETWCYWLCLAHNYRELHRTASETQTPLWRTSA